MKILIFIIYFSKKLKKIKYNIIFSCSLKIVDKKWNGIYIMVLIFKLFISWGRK